MTPLDDSLRATLSARADALAPSPDPMAGIEARARRIRRGRVAAAVAGTALAVSAVAVAVPTLSPGLTTVRSQVAHGTEAPAETAPVPANGLQRGSDDRGLLHPLVDAKVVRAWADRHPGEGAVYSVSLLSGSTQTTPSLSFAIMELWRAGGPAYAVVAQDTTTTPVLVRDDVVARDTPFIDGVVSGTGAGPMVVVALANGVSDLGYDDGSGAIRQVGHFPAPANATVNLDRTGPVAGPDRLLATFRDGRVEARPVYTGSPDGSTPQESACCG